MQNHGSVRMSGIGQGLAALNDAGVGDPTLSPYERAVFVEASGYIALARMYLIGASRAQQAGEYSRIGPGRKTHPGDLTVRVRQNAPMAVGKECVVAQFVRPGTAVGAHRAGRVSICHRRAPPLSRSRAGV